VRFKGFAFEVRRQVPIIGYYAEFERTWPWDRLRPTFKHIGNFYDLEDAQRFVKIRYPKWWAVFFKQQPPTPGVQHAD